MGNKLYVGNLPFSASEAELSEMFSQCGTVDSVRLITDRETGRSKGFAFVEMSTTEEAERSISELGGTSLEGRALTVSEARPQAPRSDRGGFGGGGGGGGGGRRDRY